MCKKAKREEAYTMRNIMQTSIGILIYSLSRSLSALKQFQTKSDCIHTIEIVHSELCCVHKCGWIERWMGGLEWMDVECHSKYTLVSSLSTPPISSSLFHIHFSHFFSSLSLPRHRRLTIFVRWKSKSEMKRKQENDVKMNKCIQ